MCKYIHFLSMSYQSKYILKLEFCVSNMTTTTFDITVWNPNTMKAINRKSFDNKLRDMAKNPN